MLANFQRPGVQAHPCCKVSTPEGPSSPPVCKASTPHGPTSPTPSSKVQAQPYLQILHTLQTLHTPRSKLTPACKAATPQGLSANTPCPPPKICPVWEAWGDGDDEGGAGAEEGTRGEGWVGQRERKRERTRERRETEKERERERESVCVCV